MSIHKNGLLLGLVICPINDLNLTIMLNEHSVITLLSN